MLLIELHLVTTNDVAEMMIRFWFLAKILDPLGQKPEGEAWVLGCWLLRDICSACRLFDVGCVLTVVVAGADNNINIVLRRVDEL